MTFLHPRHRSNCGRLACAISFAFMVTACSSRQCSECIGHGYIDIDTVECWKCDGVGHDGFQAPTQELSSHVPPTMSPPRTGPTSFPPVELRESYEVFTPRGHQISRPIDVEEINPLTFKINPHLSEAQMNRLVELFEDTLRVTDEHDLYTTPLSRPCGNQKKIRAFPVIDELSEMFRPAIDALSKNKAFMKQFTSQDIQNQRSSFSRDRQLKQFAWDNYEHLHIDGAGWLRYAAGGDCSSHRDNHIPWENTLVAFEVFSAREGSGIYQTKMKCQNGDNWTDHTCELGEGITILRPVKHQVTPCYSPWKRLRDVEARPPTKPEPEKGSILKKYYKRLFACFRSIPEEDKSKYDQELAVYRTKKDAWKRKTATWKREKYMHDTSRLKIAFMISKSRHPQRRRLSAVSSSDWQMSCK